MLFGSALIGELMPYGPWSASLHSSERTAQLRSLAALVAAAFGSDHPRVSALRRAEVGGSALQEAHAGFESLPALRKRQLLSTFAAITYWREMPAGRPE
jgi:hypothetical protein